MDAGKQRPRMCVSDEPVRPRSFRSFPARNAIFRIDVGASIGKPFGQDRIVDREE